MTKPASDTTITTVHDSKSGRFVTVKGAGALKGKMTISKKVDLTKPISTPALRRKWVPKDAISPNKTSSKGANARANTAKS